MEKKKTRTKPLRHEEEEEEEEEEEKEEQNIRRFRRFAMKKERIDTDPDRGYSRQDAA